MNLTKRPSSQRRRSGRPVARGFMLLEVLVAMLIFAIGVLGVVGLQAAMTKAQTGSKFRADASFLAQRVIANMWTDRSTLTNYAAANCTSHPRCNEWVAEVARALPNGAATIGVTALTTPDAVDGLGNVVAADVVVTITWTPPNEEQHRFVTTSSVSSKSPT